LDVKKRFSEEQIIGFLREAEKGIPVKDLCRKHGFSDASFYLWRGKYGGMDVSDAKRLKALEAENARLKRLLPGGQVKLLHPWPGQNPPPLRRGDG
jgi:putative transposase